MRYLLDTNTPTYWQEASGDLAQSDPGLAELVTRFFGMTLVLRGEPSMTLVRSIVGQQISVKVADSVWARFSVALPLVTPAAELAHDPETLRGCGLSLRKVEYVVDLARHLADAEIHVDRWSSMSDAEIMAELTAVRGIVGGATLLVLLAAGFYPEPWLKLTDSATQALAAYFQHG